MTARIGLTFPPRLLRRPSAAAYVGLGMTKFDELVEDGRMPKPIPVDGCVLWDREALDAACDALSDGAAPATQPTEPDVWDRVG